MSDIEAKDKSTKRTVVFAVIALVACAFCFFGFWFLKVSNNNVQEKKIYERDIINIAFLYLPDMIVNLKSTSSKESILKASFVIEVKNLKEKEKIDHLKPLLVDRFQTYLRELELSDLQGSAGIERVRQELFARANAICSPVNINNVLIKEFIIQ